MIPFRVTAAAYNANASPSVTLEKGDYRLRAPRISRPTPPQSQAPVNGGSRLRTTGQSRAHAYLSFLIFLLILACMFCFGAAYHLYSTRWDVRSMDPTSFFTNHPKVHGSLYNCDEGPDIALGLHEKYMTYLPHSGFHNQRIALENALVLSTLLNRTLIIPPIRLGRMPVSYVNYEVLYTSLALGGKEGLRHCPMVPPYMASPPECLEYFDYTHIPWNWLVDITEYTHYRPHIYQRKVSPDWARQRLQLNDTDVLVLSDESRYHYQYYDTPFIVSTATEGNKYMEHIYIPDLANYSQRLVQFGTLFGSSRLLLRNPDNIGIRSTVRRSMVFSNPTLVSIANRVRGAIGGPYLGVHIRVSDGQFEQNVTSNVREIWWKLIQISYGYNHTEWPMPDGAFAPNSTFLPRVPSSMPHTISQPTVCCGHLHSQPHPPSFSIPLFISTDAENPRDWAPLSAFFMTFSCTLFISDFSAQTRILNNIRNENDGLMLAPFIIPFLDAMIMGHASRVVTTEGSTFGRFIEDVLWRVYHDREIAQRG